MLRTPAPLIGALGITEEVSMEGSTSTEAQQPAKASIDEAAAPPCVTPSLADDLVRHDIELRKVERLCKEKELRAPVWLSPFVAALIAATLAALGNAIVTAITAANQVALEDRKAEQSRILEMIKTGDPDKAAVNLDFLLRTGLVTDEATVKALKKFLADRTPGQGPTLATPSSRPESTTFLSRIWKEREIPVCWEDLNASDEHFRVLVKETIASTWSKVSGVSFVGWKACTESESGVRIGVEDSYPHSKAIGQFIRGIKNGLVLNATFKEYSVQCQTSRDLCIKGIAVHEFGHILGLEHEQNHPEAPADCRALSQGESSGFVFGPYDPKSVMNFCNQKWNNDGNLSDGDIAKVRALYGASKNEPPAK